MRFSIEIVVQMNYFFHMYVAMTKPWIYNRSPMDGVRFEEALQAFKDDIAVRKYYILCLSKCFVMLT